jgi:hypothetical protein
VSNSFNYPLIDHPHLPQIVLFVEFALDDFVKLPRIRLS